MKEIVCLGLKEDCEDCFMKLIHGKIQEKYGGSWFCEMTNVDSLTISRYNYIDHKYLLLRFKRDGSTY